MRTMVAVRQPAKRRAAAHWDKVAIEGTGGKQARSWLSCAQVLRQYIWPQFGGLDWHSFIRERWCPQPRDLGLSLCCGDGALERHMVRIGILRACEGVDISPGSTAACRARAQAEGFSTLTYRVADVERLTLPPDSYDLAVGWMGLHHLTTLSRLFAEIARALRPDGVFVVNEYVGPARFQMPSLQARLVNEWLGKLPRELRRTETGVIRESFTPPTAAEVVARDPSEAVSSDRILPELERHFAIVDRVDYGGVLLQWVLADITQNFRPDDPEHQAWLERLFEAERDVLRGGLLPSDFTFIIARPRERG